ncbi:MAG: hypothetical protein RLZZ46_174, partial [Bacteroidota bacterium]
IISNSEFLQRFEIPTIDVRQCLAFAGINHFPAQEIKFRDGKCFFSDF